MSLLDHVKFMPLPAKRTAPDDLPAIGYKRTESSVQIIISKSIAQKIGIHDLTGIEVQMSEERRLILIGINETEPMMKAVAVYAGEAFVLKSNRLMRIPDTMLPPSKDWTELSISEMEMIHIIVACPAFKLKQTTIRAAGAVERAPAAEVKPYTGKKRGRPKKNAVVDDDQDFLPPHSGAF